MEAPGEDLFSWLFGLLDTARFLHIDLFLPLFQAAALYGQTSHPQPLLPGSLPFWPSAFLVVDSPSIVQLCTEYRRRNDRILKPHFYGHKEEKLAAFSDGNSRHWAKYTMKLLTHNSNETKTTPGILLQC